MATSRKTTAKAAVQSAAKTTKAAAVQPAKRAVRKKVKKRSSRGGGKGFFFAMLFVLVFALVYHFFGQQIWTELAEFGVRLTSDGAIVLEPGEVLVSFIDVGQGDAILVRSRDHAVLIDGGEHAQRNALTGYLRGAGIRRLDYVVATHPHSDHIGGLVTVLSQFEVGHVVMPDITHNTATFLRFLEVIDNRDIPVIFPLPGDSIRAGILDFAVLGPPNPHPGPVRNLNNASIVLRLEHGQTSFLFTGDAERPEEADILEAGYDLGSTVLKVGHHGSDTATTYPFLREIMPQYALISCGKDNSYGHPHDNALSRLRDADVTLFRTDLQGTITCTSDGKTVSFTTERNANTQTNPTVSSKPDAPAAEEVHYIGNVNSRKFHRPTCSGLPDEKNRVTFETRDAAIDEGYAPCGSCKP
ncbi:MAG: MBL fold metallo-hydrolase [Defluviitaleaceae bacterium]|nr:MBL fold metallo-hydrolase [Defluviitaleaceae bacterium]